MAEKFETFVLDGVAYQTRLTDKWKNRKPWEEPNPYQVTSYIPGTIMEVIVTEGQQVEEGDVLLILQAMKMNNKVTAPFAGKIKSVHVHVGDKLPKGALMIEMAEDENA